MPPPGSKAKTSISTSTEIAIGILSYKDGSVTPIKTVRSLPFTDPVSAVQSFSITNGVVTLHFKACSQYRADSCMLTDQSVKYKLVNGVVVSQTDIVINGIPSESAGWKVYENKNLGFTFKYPKDVIATSSPIEYPYLKGSVVLEFPPSYYSLQNTMHTSIAVSATSSTFAQCVSDNPQTGALPMELMVNHQAVYDSADYGDCGAGTCYDADAYTIFKDGMCYLVSVNTETHNPGAYNFSQAQMKQVDQNNFTLRTKLTDLSKKILATFQVTR